MVWQSEQVWNTAVTAQGTAGSGGGVSTLYPIPFYQSGVTMAANEGSQVARNVPDVALTADNVFIFADDGSFGTVSGTSCAAPLWAGFIALVNQQADDIGQTNVGFLNPALYAIGQGINYTNVFHDHCHWQQHDD